jgi:hypothetical protein
MGVMCCVVSSSMSSLSLRSIYCVSTLCCQQNHLAAKTLEQEEADFEAEQKRLLDT